MRRMRAWFLRFGGLFSGARRERELADEIESHLQLHIEDAICSGLNPDEARRRAIMKLGGVEATKERYRDRRGVPLLESLLQDLRYGLRILRKNPGFTAVAVLTLALGIGANTAVFSVIAALALRPLPVRDPQRLVQLASVGPVLTTPNFSYPAYARVQSENQVFADVCAVGWLNELAVAVDGDTEYLAGQIVSGNFFSFVGVDPIAGRTFTPSEDLVRGKNAVAVISYKYWHRRFGLDASVIGKSINMRGTPFEIVGVAPADFTGIAVGRSPDLYVPMMMEPAFRDGSSWLDRASFHWIQIAGRLKPGTSRQAAQTNLAIINSEILAEVPKTDWPSAQAEDFMMQSLEVVPASGGLAFNLRRRLFAPLAVLLVMVGLLLFTACANVANLLLARGAARQREIAVRLAIGAGRFRLVRQLLVEGLLIALAGGAMGLLLAFWSMPAVQSLVSLSQGGVALDLHPDPRILAFTAGVSVVSTLLFGLLPAFRSTRVDLGPTLKGAVHTGTARRSRLGVGKALVVCQIALSLLLLVGAGLFVHTLANLENLDPGFNRDNVLLFSVDPTRGGYKGAEANRMFEHLLERLQADPGVRSASLGQMTPITGGGGWDSNIWVAGYPASPGEDTRVYLNSVGPKYFETLGIPLLQGREFEARDANRTSSVAIINQMMARRFFGDADPIGRKFGWGEGEERREFEIVGLVKDSKYETMREEPPRTAYLDCFQGPVGSMTVAVRTLVKPGALAAGIRSLIDETGKRALVGGFRTLAEHVDESLGHERLMATLSSAFGILALVVAGIGLYGVTAYSMSRRGREIGIRLALGAQRSDILAMVLRETFWLIVAGFAIGLPCALLAARLVSGMLFGLTPADPLTLAAGAAVLAATALLACWVPARRATKADPLVALRYE